jgi:hypothetical protein
MDSPTARPRRRAYVHIGVPKSGTSFLQAALRANAGRLAEQGVFFPTTQHKGLFHAALELTGNHPGWGVPDRRVKGSWASLCRQAKQFDGTTVLSNELFSNVAEERIPDALAELDGLEVHVVVTARDLARQLPAEWQEGVKHGRALRFDEFLSRMLDPQRRHTHARKFWRHQDLAELLERWARTLPPEQVHVVTCPPPGAPRELLWQRFCGVVGIDTAATELPAAGANTSLGVTAVDVLRRVNRAQRDLAGRRPPMLRRTVKQSLVNGALRGDGSPPVRLPAELLPELSVVTQRWRERIEEAGYDVVGDLAELTPSPGGESGSVPQRVRPRDSRDLAVQAVAVLTREVAELRAELRRLEHGSSRRTLPVRGGGLSLVRRTWSRIRR